MKASVSFTKAAIRDLSKMVIDPETIRVIVNEYCVPQVYVTPDGTLILRDRVRNVCLEVDPFIRPARVLAVHPASDHG